MSNVSSLARAADDEQVRVIRKHHLMVRIAHWINVPTITLLILSGLSIYWASPVFKIAVKDSPNGPQDLFAILGTWVIQHVPNQTGEGGNWFYDHFALGSGNLAKALNIHWFCAYLFMVIAVVYVSGLLLGGGYRALLPRARDFKESLTMIKYYLNVVPSFVLRKPNLHPTITSKYNALQRTAYFSVSIMGLLLILSGWAIHKPIQLSWLQALFGGYDSARAWHFLLMVSVILFVIPHVILVLADGWDCFRSMIVGWSDKVRTNHDD
jgi:thiosulfate reductase cytochrome b subunit